MNVDEIPNSRYEVLLGDEIIGLRVANVAEIIEDKTGRGFQGK